jgi:hypothetical protein
MNAQPIGEQEVDRSVTEHLICDIAFADTHVVGLWCIHREAPSLSQMCVERSARPPENCLPPWLSYAAWKKASWSMQATAGHAFMTLIVVCTSPTKRGEA